MNRSKKFLTVANQTVKAVISVGHVIVGITYRTSCGQCLEIESLNGKFYLIGTKGAILEFMDGRGTSSREFKVVLETEQDTTEVINAWEAATC